MPSQRCSVTPSFLQKLFAKGWLWTTGFFGIAVSLSLTVAMAAAPDVQQMLILALVGSIGGAVTSWIFLKILWHLRVRVNGGPFHKGDWVQVIAGAYAGRTAVVYEEWHSRKKVRIDLGERDSSEVKDVFSFIQLCRAANSGTDVKFERIKGKEIT